VETVRLKSPLIKALNVLMERRISAVPVTDDHDRLIDIYTKFDVVNLARDQVYSNLDCTVEDALGVQREAFEGVYTCRKTDSLGTVIDWFINADIHRMIVVDGCRHVEGVISISDIIHYLVPSHSNKCSIQDSDEDRSESDDIRIWF
jgi:5'-AMP-activated protein kinase regulatory gamma subunit